MMYRAEAYDMMEQRAYHLGLCATSDPLKMLPMEIAIIPEISISGPIPRLANMVVKYNSDQYDRLTSKGYTLDLTKGEYEKTK